MWRTRCPSGDSDVNEIHSQLFYNYLQEYPFEANDVILSLYKASCYAYYFTKTHNSTQRVTQGTKKVILSHEWHMGFFFELRHLAYSANYRPLVVPEVITWSGNGSGISFLLQNHPRSIPDWRKILPLSCFDGVQSAEPNGAGYSSTNYWLPIQMSYMNYQPSGNSPPMQPWKLLERISHISCNTPVHWLHNDKQLQWLYVA